jgi:3-dehydroquinate synthase
VITDDNVSEIWIEDFISSNEELHHAEIIVLPAGEENKTIEICAQVWESLSDYKITRHDLIINLGGGVITDMGGFIASTFKRGLNFINIPTTLLSQVDASVGGKTGVDLGPFKNQIGVFANPDYVFIDYKYLNTLEQVQLTSGYAEMLKHGLIADDKHWNNLVSIKELSVHSISKHIHDSVNIKHKLVTADPFEKNSRKSLNFGHTIGHAIEGYLLTNNRTVPHGFAVAWGMAAEANLAFQKNLICEDDLTFITSFITSTYPKCDIDAAVIPELLDLMVNDKKNEDSINFTLLKDIGTFVINESATEEDIEKAINSILD